MINLFKKNIHSLFSFTTTSTTTPNTNPIDPTTTQCHHHRRRSISGLGDLVTATTTDEDHRPPNVLESATVKHNMITSNTLPQPPPLSSGGGIGFSDDEINGLTSCTESLGFESSDERRVDDKMDKKINHHRDDGDGDNGNDEVWRRRMVARAESRGNWRKERSFPPPLPSLNRNGKPSFYLRPVRKDGRLELTEVRIHRPEILHASRHDGRLTLRLIPDQTDPEEEDYYEEEEEEEEEQEQEQELVKEEEEKVVEEWGFPEGLRRCHEMVNQHHHHVHGNHHHLRMCGISIV